MGVSIVCIDPQDSDREQLMVKGDGGGQSTKSGPVTSAAVLKGNVVPVVTVSRGMKTKERT